VFLISKSKGSRDGGKSWKGGSPGFQNKNTPKTHPVNSPTLGGSGSKSMSLSERNTL
jgi:hypothetical protein